MTTNQSESETEADHRDMGSLLTNARICATVATTDLQRARYFYEEKLGLKIVLADERRGVYYQAGEGTMLNLYERDHAPPDQ